MVIALTLYSLALLVRTTADGLDSVEPQAIQAATAMGYTPFRRWFSVELPLAMPVVLAGLRVATVANISMVSGRGTARRRAASARCSPAASSSASTSRRSSSGWCSRCCWRWSPTSLIVLAQRALTPVGAGGGVAMNGGTFGFLLDAANWGLGAATASSTGSSST